MVILKNKDESIIVSISTDILEITSIKKNGIEFLYQKDNTWKKDFPVLFPICGMLKDDKFSYQGKEYSLKRHGFFREIKNWEIIKQKDNKVIFKYTSNGEFLDVYPWDFELTYEVTVKKDKVELRNKVKNLSDDKMFYSLGYHPAFLVEQEGIVSFDVKQELNKDSHELKYIVKNPKEKININHKKIDQIDFKDSQFYWTTNNKASAFTYVDNNKEFIINLEKYIDKTFLIWSEDNKANYVCFEPMDGCADFNERTDNNIENKDGILNLKKNKSRTHSFKINLYTK